MIALPSVPDIEHNLLGHCIFESTAYLQAEQILSASDFAIASHRVIYLAIGSMIASRSPIPTELEVSLTDYGETLRPDFAVRELEPKDRASSWQLLVRVLEPGEDFDRVVRGHGQFEASAQGRMERLLRQTGVSAGVLFNGRALRLVSAPRGESQAGWISASNKWPKARAGQSRRRCVCF